MTTKVAAAVAPSFKLADVDGHRAAGLAHRCLAAWPKRRSRPLGSVSVMVTPVASDGPRFDAVKVYVSAAAGDGRE